jgi:thiosulfate dehydrogenase [quinone] large subunit
MEIRENLKDQRTAYALLRVILGLNIFMHGAARLLVGPGLFMAKTIAQFAHAPLPHWSLVAFTSVLPWAEALIGLLLMLGLWTRVALIAGSLVILSLTFGVTLVQQWDIAGLQLTYAIAYAALLFLLHYNWYSIDRARLRKQKI